mmetsp:Transcript_25701/g.50199  ORF Transcript_25701/g.50199 Transcript_25701/m.50199 type:complete len:156 (+) Transcript_25701:283-750(+)
MTGSQHRMILRATVLLQLFVGAAAFSSAVPLHSVGGARSHPLPQLRPSAGVNVSQQRTSHADPFYFALGGGAALRLPSPTQVAGNLQYRTKALLKELRQPASQHGGGLFEANFLSILASLDEGEGLGEVSRAPRHKAKPLFHAVGRSCAPRNGPF